MHAAGVTVSRFARPKPGPPPAGTPIWVWVIYALGLLAVGVILLSLGLSAVVYLSSDEETDFEVTVATPALVVWIAIAVVAAVTLAWRRRGGGR